MGCMWIPDHPDYQKLAYRVVELVEQDRKVSEVFCLSQASMTLVC